jgi:hypothetical protein
MNSPRIFATAIAVIFVAPALVSVCRADDRQDPSPMSPRTPTPVTPPAPAAPMPPTTTTAPKARPPIDLAAPAVVRTATFALG